MKSNHRLTRPLVPMIGAWLLSTLVVQGAPDDISIGSDTMHVYNFASNADPMEEIAVLGAGGDVVWDWATGGIPPGASATTANSFTHSGITVTLPADAGTSTASSGTISITGTPPLTVGGFSFSVEVAETSDLATTFSGSYDVNISRPMDVVLVMDKSGSMGTIISGSTRRWDALEDAAGNFGNLYQGLGREHDQIGIVYFDSGTGTTSTCCDPLTGFAANIGTTIASELGGVSPGGGTAMGQGLKVAEGMLTDSTRARAVVVFTDGRQNVSPLVRTNGTGYDDGTDIASGITIATIGIDSPNGDYNTTLQNLALQNGGSYNTTDDGSNFNFEAGNSDGDLSSGFLDAFITMLEDASPQLVARETTDVASGTAPHALLSFPLNQKVDVLLLQFVFNRKFERPEIAQLLPLISVEKDGASVMANVQPSFVGNFTDTLLLKIDFDAVVEDGPPPIASAGNWTVSLGDVSDRRIEKCQVTAVADDHRLDFATSYGSSAPRAGQALPLSVDLHWTNNPIEDATVVARVFRPGETLGHALAENELTVDVSNAPDAASPGTQKFEQLWQNDEAFRNLLQRTENAVTLNHTSDGHYEAEFDGLTEAGIYRVAFDVTGTHPDAGDYQRLKVESFYAGFDGIDLEASKASTTTSNGQLVMTIRPVTQQPPNKFLGPAFGGAFAVSPAGVQLVDVTDHQDGSYTLTFEGDLDQPATLSVLDQEIYSGTLADIGTGGGDPGDGDGENGDGDEGFPLWLVWLIAILLLIVILFLILKARS